MQGFYEKKFSNSCLKNMTFFLYNVYFLILYIFNYEDSLAFYIPDTHSLFAILGFNVVLSCILKLTFTFVLKIRAKVFNSTFHFVYISIKHCSKQIVTTRERAF